MSKFFTPVQAVVAAGLLRNQGLGIPAAVTTAINGFNNTGLADACRLAIAANPTTEMYEALLTIPGCLTGMVPYSLRNTVSMPLFSTFSFDNLIADVGIQASNAMTNGTKGLTQILPAVHSYCMNSFELIGTFEKMKTTDYGDFGVTVDSYKDIVTGGVNSQYKHVVNGVSSVGYAALSNQFGNFGTMYDATDLSSLSDPRALCQNLLNQGFYLISELLTVAGIDVTSLSTSNEALVLQALANITGTELKVILTVTNFHSFKPMDNLADVLDINKVLSPAAATAAGGSFTALAKKLSNMGGKFTSFDEVKSLYSSIQDATIPSLTALPTLGPSTLFAGTTSSLGTGSGTFNNPTVYDCLGSTVGTGYIDNINSMTAIQAQVLTTTPGQQLLSAIVAAQSSPSSSAVAADIIAAANLISAGNTTLLANGLTAFNAVFDLLFVERKNLANAGIVLAEATGSISGITAFVSELHSVHTDPMHLKYSDLIKQLVTTDVYGEAISAAIAEGQNIAQLNSYGIPTYTMLDPIEYADQVLSERHC